jgi:hypothetical protein
MLLGVRVPRPAVVLLQRRLLPRVQPGPGARHQGRQEPEAVEPLQLGGFDAVKLR